MIGTSMRRLGLVLALCVAGVGNAYAQAGYNDAYHNSNNTLPPQPHWMSTLDDSTPINALNVPGTHASAALHGGNARRTQSLGLRQQLEGGVRYLELGVRGERSSAQLYHNGVNQHQTLYEAVGTVVQFLHASPTETVFVHILRDGPRVDFGLDFPAILNPLADYDAYVARNVRVDTPLRQLRGKIVWLRDPLVMPLPGLDSVGDFVSQRWNPKSEWDLYEKWGQVRHHFDAANKYGGVLPFVNHLWGEGNVAPWWVATGWTDVNSRRRKETTQWRPFSNPFPDFPTGYCIPFTPFCAIDYEGTSWLARERLNRGDQRYAGFVVADFPGAGLIMRTIDINRTKTLFVSATTGQCIDIEGGAVKGRRALLWPCHGGTNQRLTVRNHEIRVGNYCLDMENGNTNGRVLLWDCHGGINQRWTVDDLGKVRTHLRAGLCLQQTGSRAPLRLATCNDKSGDQRFIARR